MAYNIHTNTINIKFARESLEKFIRIFNDNEVVDKSTSAIIKLSLDELPQFPGEGIFVSTIVGYKND